MYYVYILQCRDKSLYTGITTDVDRRSKAHGAQKIVYKESCKDRSSASKREIEIKKLSRQMKLNLIENNK